MTPPAASTPANTAKKDETEFQVYKSSRIAMRLITPKGRRITFTNFTFITQDEALIEYLDSEIDQGLNSVTKDKVMTSDELNPMEALKREHFIEFQKQQDKITSDLALGKSREMGNFKVNALNPASSKTVPK